MELWGCRILVPLSVQGDPVFTPWGSCILGDFRDHRVGRNLFQFQMRTLVRQQFSTEQVVAIQQRYLGAWQVLLASLTASHLPRALSKVRGLQGARAECCHSVVCRMHCGLRQSNLERSGYFLGSYFNDFILPLMCFKKQYIIQTCKVFLKNLGMVTWSIWQSTGDCVECSGIALDCSIPEDQCSFVEEHPWSFSAWPIWMFMRQFQKCEVFYWLCIWLSLVKSHLVTTMWFLKNQSLHLWMIHTYYLPS